MGLTAWGGPGLGLSGAAQTNRCCWSSHEKQTAIKPRASRDREFYPMNSNEELSAIGVASPAPANPHHAVPIPHERSAAVRTQQRARCCANGRGNGSRSGTPRQRARFCGTNKGALGTERRYGRRLPPFGESKTAAFRRLRPSCFGCWLSRGRRHRGSGG